MSVGPTDNTVEVLKSTDEAANRCESQQQDDEVTLLSSGDTHKVTALSRDTQHGSAIQALHRSDSASVKSDGANETKGRVKLPKLATLTLGTAPAKGGPIVTKAHKALPQKFTKALVPATSEEKPMTNEFKFGHIFAPQAQAFIENLVTTQLGRLDFESSVHLFNANHIVLSSGEKVIAMAYPMLCEDEGRFHFWNMLQEHGVSNIIDLTEREYQQNVRYYNEGRIECKHGILTVEVSSQGSEYQRISVSGSKDSATMSVEVTRRHYTEWSDNEGLELTKFLALVDYLSEKISKGVLIHCVEGMGRTMTLIVGEEIKRLIQDRKITSDNYEVEVAEAINRLAKQRGNCVIKTLAQQALLLDAASFWLDRQGESQS